MSELGHSRRFEAGGDKPVYPDTGRIAAAQRTDEKGQLLPLPCIICEYVRGGLLVELALSALPRSSPRAFWKKYNVYGTEPRPMNRKSNDRLAVTERSRWRNRTQTGRGRDTFFARGNERLVSTKS